MSAVVARVKRVCGTVEWVPVVGEIHYVTSDKGQRMIYGHAQAMKLFLFLV